jgi:hypothetical protein
MKDVVKYALIGIVLYVVYRLAGDLVSGIGNLVSSSSSAAPVANSTPQWAVNYWSPGVYGGPVPNSDPFYSSPEGNPWQWNNGNWPHRPMPE